MSDRPITASEALAFARSTVRDYVNGRPAEDVFGELCLYLLGDEVAVALGEDA